jgi:antitoxin (DNA-binding transcriptional repressor) of toxin-antitoxin stability system
MIRKVARAELHGTMAVLVDAVASSGEPVEITQDGRVVARIVPTRNHLTLADLRGSAHWANDDDIIGPVDSPWPGDAD